VPTIDNEGRASNSSKEKRRAISIKGQYLTTGSNNTLLTPYNLHPAGVNGKKPMKGEDIL
jgi:transketolase C-terminal domain/subunit